MAHIIASFLISINSLDQFFGHIATGQPAEVRTKALDIRCISSPGINQTATYALTISRASSTKVLIPTPFIESSVKGRREFPRFRVNFPRVEEAFDYFIAFFLYGVNTFPEFYFIQTALTRCLG
jgi:hypothetical protein